jgi:hypothetical protein
MDWTGLSFPRPDDSPPGARRYWIGTTAHFKLGPLGDAPAMLELLCAAILFAIDVRDIDPACLARYFQDLRHVIDTGRGESIFTARSQ